MITYLKNYLFDLKEFITNLDLKCQIPTLDLLLSHLEVGISPRQGRILHVFPLFLKLFYFIFIIDVLSFLFLWCSLLVLLGHKNFQMIFKKAQRNNRLLCTYVLLLRNIIVHVVVRLTNQSYQINFINFVNSVMQILYEFLRP